MRLPVIALAAMSLATGAVAAPANSASFDPTGEWLVAEKIARIKIADCTGRIWGVVSWEAQAGTDSKNPDPSLRSRPTLGMPILLGMRQSKPNQWDGDIYNSENGRTYSANISLVDPNTLRVQGCVLGFLCGGENWTRVEPTDTPGGVAKRNAPPSPGKRKPAAKNQPPQADDVCLKVSGAAR